MKLRKWNVHPGDGYIKVECDVCERVIYRKDATLITDKYNTLSGSVVCNRCIDKTNEQSVPITITENPPPNPELLRPTGSDTFSTSATDTRLPSAPRNVMAQYDALSAKIRITWDAPLDNGSSSISGYYIKVAQPALSSTTDLITNTATGSTQYLDATTDYTQGASYIVAAINGAGQGPFSEHGVYMDIANPNTYLTTGAGEYLTTTAGEYLRVGV